MIPKKIHYCWFGRNPLPETVKKCLVSWEKYCPEYEIKIWNEDNYDVHKNNYVHEAYELKKYAFVSDYARLDILNSQGGVYLDTDVELIRPLDNLLSENCYMGFELPGRINTGLGFGSVPNHPLLKENIRLYDKENIDSLNSLMKKTCIDFTMEAIKNIYDNDFKETNQLVKYKDLTIYSTEYFCPLNMETNKLVITDNTYSIHHYDATWYSENLLIRSLNKKVLPVKIKTKKIVNNIFGDDVYEKIKSKLKR